MTGFSLLSIPDFTLSKSGSKSCLTIVAHIIPQVSSVLGALKLVGLDIFSIFLGQYVQIGV